MKEARIILPVVDGGLDVHQRLMTAIAKAFGGYTVAIGVGGWISPEGESIEDDVVIFDIACDENEDWTFDKLFQIAVEHANLLSQDAVYIRYPDGFVEIAQPKSVPTTHHTRGGCKSEPDPVHVADDGGMEQAIGATLDRDNVTAGVKRLPQVGGIWRNRRGDVVGIVERYRSGPFGGLLKCRTLRGVGPTHYYVTFAGEAAGIQGSAFDLIDYVTSF